MFLLKNELYEPGHPYTLELEMASIVGTVSKKNFKFLPDFLTLFDYFIIILDWLRYSIFDKNDHNLFFESSFNVLAAIYFN